MKLDKSRIEMERTPFYFYDMNVLHATLDEIKKWGVDRGVHVHYAIKANNNPDILKIIRKAGLGADCVSGGEILAAGEAGFSPENIFYAGVGKTDEEIILGLEKGIGCFNVESVEELQIIQELASECGKVAPVALRVNPDIDAHTHEYITTGLEENKFGIDMRRLDEAVEMATKAKNIDLIGLHFHIGSQITINDPFALLCERINSFIEHFREKGVEFRILNVGGGLGIDYDDPDGHPVPDFKGYFDTLVNGIKLSAGQQIHCELGRSVVGQCGSLISKVIFVKEGIGRKFLIVDAGFNDLIRPALYGAHHKIEAVNPSDEAPLEKYDVVGPICESSDVFGKDEILPRMKRGDYVALRSAGAYGESMSSQYNMRRLPGYLLV
jgi:diaminopimelate decarboxylase